MMASMASMALYCKDELSGDNSIISLANLEGLSIDQLLERLPYPPSNTSVSMRKVVSTTEIGNDSPSWKKKLRRYNSDASMSLVSSSDEADTFFDLFCRACRGVLHDTDRARLYEHLLTLNPFQFEELHQCVHDSLTEKIPVSMHSAGRLFKKSKQLLVSTTKHCLDFGVLPDSLAPLDQTLNDTVIITNKTNRDKISFSFHPTVAGQQYTLQVSPMSGTIKADSGAFASKMKGKKMEKKGELITFSLIIKAATRVNAVVQMSVEGGLDHFFTVKMQSEKGLFGTPIQDVTIMPDASGGGYAVPPALAVLRDHLVAGKGLEQEGVFRIPGDDSEIRAIKRALSEGTFELRPTNDMHALASTIKLFYRQLPSQVLSDLSMEEVLSCDSSDRCQEILSKIKEPNKGLLMWLIELLAEAASLTSQNQMSAHTLAICVAPNLFTAPPNVVLQPHESLRISQTVVSFVMNLINVRMNNS